MLNGSRTQSVAEPMTPTPKRRKFSAAARRKMREAQQRRWAAVKGQTKPPAPAAKAGKPKRRLSAAGRKAIIAATKKRWALKRAGTAKQ
jgi:hypothetical protein